MCLLVVFFFFQTFIYFIFSANSSLFHGSATLSPFNSFHLIVALSLKVQVNKDGHIQNFMICVVEQIESKACINHSEGKANC